MFDGGAGIFFGAPMRSALQEIAQNFLRVLARARVILIADSASLVAQFETEKFFFQIVETLRGVASGLRGDAVGASSGARTYSASLGGRFHRCDCCRCAGGLRCRPAPQKNHAKNKQRGKSGNENVFHVAVDARWKSGDVRSGISAVRSARIRRRILRSAGISGGAGADAAPEIEIVTGALAATASRV